MEQPASPLPLTKRQNEILKLIQSGFSNKEVARKLAISDGTVKQHLVDAYRRLKVNNRTKAAQLFTQAEEGSFFLAPSQTTATATKNRITAKTATFAASLQPISCVKMHIDDSISLLHALGSEKFNQFNQHLLKTCEQAASRFDGIVQGSIDGPLVLFGVRHMREDDPLRAICCAGLITQAMEQKSTELALQASPLQIMILSDDVITCTNGQTTTIQGELLQPIRQTAKAGQSIVLSNQTRQAANRLYARHGALSPHLPGSMACALTHSDEITYPNPPFIGRDVELESLHRLVAEAIHGHSKAILVVGEAGFGETRLVQKFREELASRKEIRWLSGSCHSVAQMVPLHPFLPILETLAGCDLTASGQQRWTELLHWIQSLPEDQAKSGQTLLDWFQDSRPQKKPQPGHHTLLAEWTDFFVNQFRALLPPSPSALIVFLDNLQWLDPFSKALLTNLANRLNGSSIWLLGAGRKAELRSLSNQSAWHVLSLSRLPDRDILRLLRHMPVARRINQEQLQLLVDWCHGVPLFAVEMAHHLAKIKKSALPMMIHTGDLFPDTLLCMILERVHALVGMDQKVLHALAAGSKEITLQQLLKLNLHGDSRTTEAVVTHLHQTGLLKITELDAEKILSFGNEMVRAAIRKTLPACDLI